MSGTLLAVVTHVVIPNIDGDTVAGQYFTLDSYVDQKNNSFLRFCIHSEN